MHTLSNRDFLNKLTLNQNKKIFLKNENPVQLMKYELNSKSGKSQKQLTNKFKKLKVTTVSLQDLLIFK